MLTSESNQSIVDAVPVEALSPKETQLQMEELGDILREQKSDQAREELQEAQQKE